MIAPDFRRHRVVVHSVAGELLGFVMAPAAGAIIGYSGEELWPSMAESGACEALMQLCEMQAAGRA